MPILTVPFAHTIEPNSLGSLADEVGFNEWQESMHEMSALASIQHPLGGGASYYVLFLDPTRKTLQHVINANLLYLMFDTKFYNEEIHLITPKK